MSNNNTILSINNLSVNFKVNESKIFANNNISLKLNKGEILGIVGESGSGKTVLCKSVIKLLSTPPAEYIEGQIIYNNKDILSLSDSDLREIRKNEIAMIFQNPMSSFNPVRTVGSQIIENLYYKNKLTRIEIKNLCLDLLTKVEIPNPELRYNEYPHQWSGGMLQRAAIAMAIRNSPKILLADEPTTALDVTIQSQILALLLNIQKKNNMSMIFISHDLAVVSQICDRIAVMYAGKLLEIAKTKDLFNNPKHPYTRGLLEAIPRIGKETKKLKTIPGDLPNMSEKQTNCIFRSRCQRPSHDCKEGNIEMGLIEIYPEHWVDQCCVNCG
tara:strand:- start:903 stop:1889 length:987 start_codon:yes stop_codon:yes gene_type:complete